MANFRRLDPAIELLLLGNVATLFDQPIEFDPVATTILGDQWADALSRPKCRAGWEL